MITLYRFTELTVTVVLCGLYVNLTL